MDNPPAKSKTEKLQIVYMELGKVALWDDNPKRHNIPELAESIAKHGFRNAPIFDAALNEGNGGIIGGNGRILALQHLYETNRPEPRGIVVKSGSWFVPIQVGINAQTEAEAIAYAIDDNNTTMSGGNFSAYDISKMWERDDYVSLLAGLSKEHILPITVSEEDFEFLTGFDSFPFNPVPDFDGDAETKPYEKRFLLSIEGRGFVEVCVEEVKKVLDAHPEWQARLDIA